jgi:hypothetical protein
MRMRWRLILPVIGLLFFTLESYHSFYLNPFKGSGRYHWWSAIRLDSDPFEKRSRPPSRQGPSGPAGPVSFDEHIAWVHAGWLARTLTLSALPAFMIGMVIVSALSNLGVSEVTSFMISMPLLIFAWYYFVGWLLDRRIEKRSRRRQAE